MERTVLDNLVDLFILANSMEGERFCEIEGFNGRYWISDFGRIVSCDRRKNIINFLHPYIDSTGYYHATLRSKPNKRKVRVQTLVGEYWVEKPNSDFDVINHITGCKLFNYYKDIEWTTRRLNCDHAVKTGLHNLKGEKHPNSKLTLEKVANMRSLREQGLTYKEIGDKFGVCRRQASDVVRGINWNAVTH